MQKWSVCLIQLDMFKRENAAYIYTRIPSHQPFCKPTARFLRHRVMDLHRYFFCCLSPRLVVQPRLENLSCPTILPITVWKIDGFIPFLRALIRREYQQSRNEFEFGLFIQWGVPISVIPPECTKLETRGNWMVKDWPSYHRVVKLLLGIA